MTVYFCLKPSRQLAIGMLALHGGAWIILVLVPLPVGFRVLAILGSFGVLYQTWNQQIRLQSSTSVKSFWYANMGEWRLCDLEGKIHKAQLKPSGLCMQYCVLLNFMLLDNRERRILLMLPDSLSPSDWKHLRRMILGKWSR